MISLARGAALTCTSMPSKWLRTKAASLWPSGMSSVVPGPLRFFDDGISAAPLPSTLRTGAPIFGCRIAAACSGSPVSPRARPLAVTVRLRPFDAQGRHRLFGQEVAELLADLDQRREILDIPAGKGVFNNGNRGRAPARRRDLLPHLQHRLLDDRYDLANDRIHGFAPRFPVSADSVASRMDQTF